MGFNGMNQFAQAAAPIVAPMLGDEYSDAIRFGLDATNQANGVLQGLY